MSEAFVYLWYDALNKMYYLGKHLGVPTDNYAHSSVRMESFTMISKPAHMHRKILAYGTHYEMVELEHDLLVSRKVFQKKKRRKIKLNASRLGMSKIKKKLIEKLKSGKQIIQRRLLHIIKNIMLIQRSKRKEQPSARLGNKIQR